MNIVNIWLRSAIVPNRFRGGAINVGGGRMRPLERTAVQIVKLVALSVLARSFPRDAAQKLAASRLARIIFSRDTHIYGVNGYPTLSRFAFC